MVTLAPQHTAELSSVMASPSAARWLTHAGRASKHQAWPPDTAQQTEHGQDSPQTALVGYRLNTIASLLPIIVINSRRCGHFYASLLFISCNTTSTAADSINIVACIVVFFSKQSRRCLICAWTGQPVAVQVQLLFWEFHLFSLTEPVRDWGGRGEIEAGLCFGEVGMGSL